MANNPFPSGTWVRQALGGNLVKITFIPSRRKSKPSFSIYDKLADHGKKDLGWKDVFKNIPGVDIDKGQIILRISADKTSTHLTWIPDNPAEQLVDIVHQLPQVAGGGPQGPAAYAICVTATSAVLTPAGAMVACSPALLLPGP